MATNADDRRGDVPNTTSNPARQDQIDAIDRQKNDLATQADYQARPETDQPDRANVPRTSTAQQAELAAGGSPDDDNRPDAERAFRESRGDRAERDGRVS